MGLREKAALKSCRKEFAFEENLSKKKHLFHYKPFTPRCHFTFANEKKYKNIYAVFLLLSNNKNIYIEQFAKIESSHFQSIS